MISKFSVSDDYMNAYNKGYRAGKDDAKTEQIARDAAEITRLRAEVERLRAALKPFAPPPGYADLDTDAPDHGPIITLYSPTDQVAGHTIRRGDFRRAREAMGDKG